MNLPEVKRKTISWRNFERVYPLLFSTLGLIVYLIIPKKQVLASLTQKFTSPDFLNTFITVEATLFGFLLTVLSIVLQMNNKGIEKIKEHKRYGQLISFGKHAVLSSLMLLVLSIFIILLKGEVESTKLLKILHHALGFMAVYNILATYRFTNIFFFLSKLNGS